jgi:hypothetical protein
LIALAVLRLFFRLTLIGRHGRTLKWAKRLRPAKSWRISSETSVLVVMI